MTQTTATLKVGDKTVESPVKAGPTATLKVGDKTVELPVKAGTVGPSVVDISKLYAQTGMFTYDPGFTSTASTESKITYIDGDAGVLLYRGYPIDQLAEHGDFLETCYLLLYGELPTASQKADFDYRVTRHTMVHEQMTRFFNGFRRDAHPMSVMVACVGALAAFYHDSTDINDPWQREVASIRMIAKAHHAERIVLVLRSGDVFRNVLDTADLAEHLERRLVGAAMRGTPQAGDAGGDAGERVRA